MNKINGNTKEHPEQIEAFLRRIETTQGPSDPSDSILPPLATIMAPVTPFAVEAELEEYEILMGYSD